MPHDRDRERPAPASPPPAQRPPAEPREAPPQREADPGRDELLGEESDYVIIGGEPP